jgi:hypothetical protein
VEASGLLNLGGASAVAAVAVARWKPTRRIRRRPIDLDLVREGLHDEHNEQDEDDEMATDGDPIGVRPMAISPMPTSAADATASTVAGLPPEQLYTWLEWVQDDLRRIDARMQRLESARSQLREQERLLGELLHSAAPLTRG